MRKFLFGAIAVLSVGGTLALADTITFGTPSGSVDTKGDSVSAQALVTSSSGKLTIALSNFTANIKDAGQLLSDFSVTLSNGDVSSASLVSASADLITVNSGGTFTSSGYTDSADWTLSTNGNTVLLNGLGTGQPEDLVIGPACSDGTYCNANGSIAGNGPHNPVALNPLTFTLDITGVTSSTVLSDAIFSFGTDAGDDIRGVPTTPTSPVPEPASFVLLGLGLLAAGCARKRASRRNS